MSEIMDLTVIEIKPEQAPTLYRAGGLDDYLEQIRQAVNEVPDLTTKKGRDRVASLAAQVSRSKTAIEKPGRRKAQEEADRIRHEAEQREQARLAEEKRKADEQARREADVKHRKAVGTEIVKALLANTSLTRDQAIEVLTAVKDGRIPHTGISY